MKDEQMSLSMVSHFLYIIASYQWCYLFSYIEDNLSPALFN